MSNSKMSFEEIKADKEKFLNLYGIKDKFNEQKLYSWEDLLEIGEDYEQKRNNEYFQYIQEYIAEISKFENVHSYRYRIKTTDSLLVKIITKHSIEGKKITKENYFKKISDLLGIRILYIFKNDYLSIHKQIMEKYGDQLAENVHLKLRDGDEEKTYAEMIANDDIKVERNKVYRSIHYTFYAKQDQIKETPKIEIQTRTIFEEGWSEINHKLVYKKNIDAHSHLEKVSGILSELIGSCDAIGSLMKYIYEESTESIGEGIIESNKHSSLTPQIASERDQIVGDAIRKFLLNKQ